MAPAQRPPGDPATPAGGPPQPSRGAILVALLVVAALSAAALFVSGFTLGLREAERGARAGADRALAPFLEAYRRVTSEYVGEAPPQRLVEGAIRGMFEALGDPFSSYLTQEEYDEGLAGLASEFEGIGAVMAAQDRDGASCVLAGPACRLTVERVLAGSPAQAAGLVAGDVLVAVDGVAVDGQGLDEVVRRVRGPRGTPVTLTLQRAGEGLELEVVRDVVRTEDVRTEVLADGRVAYLRVEGFSANVAADFRQALKGHLDAGVERFVIDLRDDPGGYVDAAVSLVSQFVPSGPVYWELGPGGEPRAIETTGDGLATEPSIRVAVLVNPGSASASEIVAGALQDSGRATIVGQRTFGKGSIQQWHLLPGEGGGVRISIARWLTPSQRSIDGAGIVPDVEVEAAAIGDQDPQLDAAVRVLLEDPAATGPEAPAGVVSEPGAPRGSLGG